MKKNIVTVVMLCFSIITIHAQTSLTTESGSIGTGNGTTTPDLLLKTGSASGTSNTRMTITNTGRVGIGMAPTTNALEVNGTISATSLIVNGVTYVASPWIINGTNISTANTGNVGIGVASPTVKFEVNGTFRAGNVNSTTGSFLSSNPANNMTFTTNNTVKMTVLTGGNVGIGVTAPAYKLDVAGGVNATAFTLNGAPVVSSQWTTSASDIYRNSGNVGIGTTTPTQLLHVNGTTLSNQFTSGTGSFASNGINNVTLLTGTTARLSILNSNGNVGIGILNPDTKLHVAGNLVLDNGSNATLFLGSGSSNLNRYLQLSNSLQNTAASGLKAGGILISNDYNYANPPAGDLIVTGKVGIGTNFPSNPFDYSLAVNGNIGAKDMRVERNSGTWPDYVFSDTYELKPLSEVEVFIKENKHLEGVPSAAEVKENGHSLPDMDELLLKKVEELTLHIIEQQKQIDELKKALEVKEKKKRRR